MDSETITLTFHGGAGTVTGANFLLEDGRTRILVDCGFLQGERFAPEKNREPFPYDPSSIDALLVTHAHMDHIGRIPKLVRSGFRGVIYSTTATKELARIMYEDSLAIMEEEAREEGTLPLYEVSDVTEALGLWRTVRYHEKIDIDVLASQGTPPAQAKSSTRGRRRLSFLLKDAGHILGSAIVEITHNDRKIVFTGDLGNSPAPLLRDTEVVTDADYLVMESVYGDKNHEPKDERDQKLRECITKTIRRGGTLMIPSFSIERTQVLLYELNNLVEDKKIPPVPVFLDSPLSIAATALYRKHIDAFNKGIQEEIREGDDIFRFPRLSMTKTVADSKKINSVAGPKIVIAGAGMLEGGRILHHARLYLPDPRSTLLLVGFQAPGTLGRRIEDGAKEVTIVGRRVVVRAHVENIRGYSAHKDSDHLVEFVSHTARRAKKVFVAMGEPKASSFLAQRLHDYLGVNAIVPEAGNSFTLDA